MKLLVDTHVFLWLMTDPNRVAPAIQAACNDPDNQLVLSVVSLWEMQIKAGLNKLTLYVPLKEMVREQVDEGPFELLPVLAGHVFALESLPPHHQDPFDRLLIAQAVAEGATFASQDRKVEQYSQSVPLLG